MKFNKKNVAKFAFVAIEFILLVAAVVVLAIPVIVNKTNGTAQNKPVESTEKTETVSKNADKASDGVIPNSNFEMVSKNESVFTYYRDKVTNVVFVCYDEYDSGALVELTDPKTGLPLTYENYLKYQEELK